jgi:hypothetical protein
MALVQLFIRENPAPARGTRPWDDSPLVVCGEGGGALSPSLHLSLLVITKLQCAPSRDDTRAFACRE